LKQNRWEAELKPSLIDFNGWAIFIALPIQVNGSGKMSRMAEDLAEYIEGLGYKTIESHMVYIHSSLTREIMVYEKT